MASSPEDAAGSDTPRPTLTVAAVARRLGVAPATLRTWDRRYGLGPSAHTAGAHRRYSVADVARLVVMRRLTLEGVAPSEAASIALTTNVENVGGTALATVTSLPTAASPSDLPEKPGDLGRAGGGRVIALPEGTPAARGLARAAMALDSFECARILRESAQEHDVVHMWESLAMPVLVAVGERWETSGTGVDVEHLLSEAVLTVLRGTTGGLRRPRNERPVLLVCAEGEQHSLPVHVLAAALAERGIGTRVLGAGVPRQALASAVRRSGPAVVFVYARLPVGAPEQLEELPRLRPPPLVLVGGRGWDDTPLPSGAQRVPSLRGAVEQVAAVVGG